MKITTSILIIGMMIALAANASIQMDEVFEHNGVMYDSRDLTKIPDPSFMAKRIERELIQKKANYINAGSTLRWLAASLDCEFNAIYRAEYKTHINEWIKHATNWPAVLMLSTDLSDGGIDLFIIAEILETHNPSTQAVSKAMDLNLLMQGPFPVEEDEEEEEGILKKTDITDRETKLNATIDSVKVLEKKVIVRYTIENKTNSAMWLPHFSENQGWFLITRSDGSLSVSSDRLKGGHLFSWKLFHPGEKETRAAVFGIGKCEQLQPGESTYWNRDPLVTHLLKKYDVRFLGDTAIARSEEKEVMLNISLDNPEMFAWLQRREKRFVPELPKLKGLHENYSIKKCTGFICKPVSITLDLTL